MTAGAVLMEVLDRTQTDLFRAQLEESGGPNMPDGCQPMAWELRYALAHQPGPATWLAELEHVTSHVMAAETPEELRSALIQQGAIVAAWVTALDARTAEAGE